jgi:hypothetical protein
MEKTYGMAEDLFVGQECSYVLPPWAMTWPGGQLSGIGRNGCYMNNIRRYESVFLEVFSEEESAGTATRSRVPSASKLRFVNVVPLEFLSEESKVKSILTSLMCQVDSRRGQHEPLLREQLTTFCPSNDIHRNASGILASSVLEPTTSDSKQLTRIFAKDSAELGTMTGLKIGWMATDAPLS